MIKFIRENYKYNQLFLSHNHPTTLVFKHIILQILDKLDIQKNTIEKYINISNINQAELHITKYILTPYDIKIHGLKYEHAKNWKRDGIYLIEEIFRKGL